MSKTTSTPTRTEQARDLVMTIEDRQREIRELAGMLKAYFAAEADAKGRDDDDLPMMAAFGFEHVARRIFDAAWTAEQTSRDLWDLFRGDEGDAQ